MIFKTKLNFNCPPKWLGSPLGRWRGVNWWHYSNLVYKPIGNSLSMYSPILSLLSPNVHKHCSHSMRTKFCKLREQHLRIHLARILTYYHVRYFKEKGLTINDSSHPMVHGPGSLSHETSDLLSPRLIAPPEDPPPSCSKNAVLQQ